MASNGDEVRVAAVRELARREIARREQNAAPKNFTERLQQALAKQQQASQTPTFFQGLDQQMKGAFESGAQIATGAGAGVAAGLAGLGQGALNLGRSALGLPQGTPAAQRIERVQDAMTYQPKTPEGMQQNFVGTAPLRGIGAVGTVAGEHVANATGSPALGAAVNTGIQFLPSLLFRGARGKPAPVASAPAAAEAAARTFVKQRTTLRWDALSDAVKQQLRNIAADSETLDRLDPAALERQARLESLPVPIKATRAQLTRDRAEFANEGTLGVTKEGAPLAATRDAQSPAILDNLEVLKGRVRGKGSTASTATTPEQVGLSVQDAALRVKLKASQERVKALYKEAESAGDLQGRAPTAPLRQLLIESPDLQHLGYVDSWLKKQYGSNEARALRSDDPNLTPDRNSATLKELEDLRQAAVARAMDGGTEGYYAGKVIRAIDQTTEGVGGNAYKAARAARKAQALEFEDQGAVARLVENKSRTDRATALEDTWRKTVLGGSIEDLRNVQRSLLTGGTDATRIAGRRAWRDIRAQTIQYIQDRATKSAAPLANGTKPVSAAGMQEALAAIGPDKLEAIFGKGTVARLNEIMKATQDLRTEPPRIHPGASTFGNAIAFLEKSLGKIPIIGDTASGTIRAAAKVHEFGRRGREVREAQTLPLDEGATSARGAISGRRASNALGNLLPAVLPPLERDTQ